MAFEVLRTWQVRDAVQKRMPRAERAFRAANWKEAAKQAWQ